MKSAVPKVSQTARLLLLNVEGWTGPACSCSGSVTPVRTATAQYATTSRASGAAAAAVPGGKPPGSGTPPPAGTAAAATSPAGPLAKQPAATPKAVAAPAAASQTTPAAAAAAAGQQAAGGTPEAASSSSSPSGSSSSSSSGGGGGGNDGGKGSSWLTTAALLALPAGTYYYYQHQKDQYIKEQGLNPQPAAASLGSLLKGGKELVSNITSNIPDMSQISSAVKGAGKKLTEQADRLKAQKQQDEESGFKILPPEVDSGTTAAAATAAGHLAAADDAAAAAAAARDSLSAAADEFPGSTEGSAAATTTAPASTTAQQAAAAAAGMSVEPQVQHVDITPINALFSEVANIDYSGGSSSSSSSNAPAQTTNTATAEDAARITSSLAAVAAAQQQQQQQQQPPPAAAAAAAVKSSSEATPTVAAAAAEYRSDTELEQLCRKLGLKHDLTPAGLIAAANAAGLGAYSSSSGAPVPAQVAQLHQATADARLLGALLSEVGSLQEVLQQQLTTAHREKEWAEEAAKKRESSLTEHFKELLREQSRIAQATTAAAVKEAQEVLLADLTAAQLQERQQRLAAADELRARVNALALAFEQRTSQVRSAHDVNKIGVGVVALSRALEQGAPIAQQLKHLAVGCPNDPVVAAVASSLPESAATAGLPTLQQLQQQFDGVATAAAEAAYFTDEGHGGVLARAAAKMAVKLKVNAGVSAAGADKNIYKARELLQQGKLLAAADALSIAAAGTHAAAVVQQWVAAARARAVADQGVKLLQAHATTTAVAAQL